MIKKISFVLVIVFSSYSYSCDYTNLTAKKRYEEREQVYLNMDNPGVRLAWKDMKKKNKKYLIGTVDKVIKNYEKSLCESFDSPEFEKNNPGVKIKIQKMDFKGYLLTCLKNCKGFDLQSHIARVEAPVFPPDKEVPTKSVDKFKLIMASANNYQEGYVKARILDEYPNYNSKDSLSDFIQKELKLAINSATDNKSVDLNDKIFQDNLSQSIVATRAENLEQVNPKFKKLIKALDVLMEIPFTGSNNFEEELKLAISDEHVNAANRGKHVVSAQSGDDLTLVLKQNGKMVKVVGADAKGLGVLNMMTRLEGFIEFSKDGKTIESMQDVLNISKGAIAKADERMEASMKNYQETMEHTLANSQPGKSIDKVIKEANDIYIDKQKKNPLLMEMRAGAINPCGQSTKCVMDRVTTIHNTLKKMEDYGVKGHFGDSCLGTEYWARKYGAKPLFTAKEKKKK
ncbi:MAG: hypothetical protein HON90_05200 [Halobacteriovoraceae bacterium]|jgi:hypothetical protein|nr:hypothetical protein [Halobacteriovoraceae bacterium]